VAQHRVCGPTFFSAGSSLSIGVFFSLMIVSLSHTPPSALE
jgi:hypothetical protein